MKFQLDALDTRTLSERGVDMQVRNIGTNEPLSVTPPALGDAEEKPVPVSIRLLGPDSDKYLQLQRAVSAARMQRAQDASRASGALDPAQEMRVIDEEEIDTLSAVTVAWTGVFDAEWKAIPCNAENAAALYRAYPVIRDQAYRFMQMRSNFLLRPAGG
ncbi:MAG TPA: hypothetical protein VI229_00420 [Burkholderiales bacterium]